MNEDHDDFGDFGDFSGSAEESFFDEQGFDGEVVFRPRPPLMAIAGAAGGALTIGAGIGVGAALLMNMLTAPPDPIDPHDIELITVTESLDRMSINLRDDGGLRRLTVEVQVQAELADPEYLAAMAPPLRDAVICLASDYTAEELLVVQGRRRFRHELEERLAVHLRADVMQQVHLTQFVVQ